jgi:hypothetical protein
MSSTDHTFERLSLAIEYLATHSGSLAERALDAYCNHIQALRADEFSDRARPKFEELNDFVRQIIDPIARKPEAHDPFEIAKKEITASTARKLAVLLWHLYAEVEDDLIENRRGR